MSFIYPTYDSSVFSYPSSVCYLLSRRHVNAAYSTLHLLCWLAQIWILLTFLRWLRHHWSYVPKTRQLRVRSCGSAGTCRLQRAFFGKWTGARSDFFYLLSTLLSFKNSRVMSAKGLFYLNFTFKT